MSKRNIKVYPLKTQSLCEKCEYGKCLDETCYQCPMIVSEPRLITKFNCYCTNINYGSRCERFKKKEVKDVGETKATEPVRKSTKVCMSCLHNEKCFSDEYLCKTCPIVEKSGSCYCTKIGEGDICYHYIRREQ